MIKANEAVQIARAQMSDWFGDDLNMLELEEVQLSDDEQAWLVTLGYSVKRVNPTASELMSAPVGAVLDSVRTYKVFAIDVTSGDIRSMKRPAS